MSKGSNVGSSQVYGNDDQRPNPGDEITAERYNEGKSAKGAHSANDPKDERSIANKLAAETKHGDGPENDQKARSTFEQNLGKKDPTAPARMHGNEPSKGAKIDAELQAEDEAEMAKKGEFGPSSGKH